MTYIPRAFRYLRPYAGLAVVSVAVIFLSGAIGLLAPWPLKILVDYVFPRAALPPTLHHLLGPFASSSGLIVLALVVGGLLVTLLDNALTVLGNYVNVRIEQNMVLDFRGDLFAHAQRLSLAFHDRKRSGMIIYAINSQADAAARLVMSIPPLAQSAVTLVGMFWIVFHMDRYLALLSLTVVPLLYYSVGYYMTHIQSRLVQVKVMEGESLSIVHEAISMLRVIVAFGREGYEHRRFLDQGRQAVDARVKITVRQTLFSLAVNTITAAGTALVLWFGARRVMQGQLKVGDLLVVLTYIAMVYRPLEAISTAVGQLQDTFITLKMAFDILDLDPEIKDVPGAIALGRCRGHVRYQDVSFSYTGRVDTLRDINFEARPGEVIAIVGPTGAGKSTLLSLLPRFYAAASGRVMLDGHDITQVTLRSLRNQISMVLQEPLLFSGTIAQNIRYGRLDATMDEVIEAAKAANAHEFISQLPQGYETELGERGAQVSGGERQRISVARAFLKDAPILILDEPTSSIDSRTESVILDALDRLMVGRTTFMIAHRLSTVRKADLILVLDQGRLIEHGTHEQLLRRGGLYRQLHEIQSAGRVAEEDELEEMAT